MRLRLIVVATALLLGTAGCAFTSSASRYAAAPGVVPEPFWCAPADGVALTPNACSQLSVQLDVATAFAYAHFHPPTTTSLHYVAGIGAAVHLSGPRAGFDPGRPDTLRYDGTGARAQIATLEWNVASVKPPSGFVGPNDVWKQVADKVWHLRVWILRPFQNERNLFAATHPCLGASGPIYDINAACYTWTHPHPFEVVVSNDDGYNAPGIDAAVEALRALPKTHVLVSAPATNQSGSGSKSTPPPLHATKLTTLSGYPAWAVQGYPVDAVHYALDTLHANPDLVVSGINNGQNIGPLISVSGTVGAARAGGKAGIPAVAVSQGLGSPPDFPSGAHWLIAWVKEFLYGRAGRPLLEPVTNVNVPTCTAGTIRGFAIVRTATDFGGRSFDPSDCTSTLTHPADDVDAFLNGYVSISNIGVG